MRALDRSVEEEVDVAHLLASLPRQTKKGRLTASCAGTATWGLWAFDPAAMSWVVQPEIVSTTSELPTAISFPGITTMDGNLYVYGGNCPNLDCQNLKLLEFETDTSSWTDIELSAASDADPADSPPRFGHGFTAAAGRLYVLGGSSYTGKIFRFSIFTIQTAGVGIRNRISSS